MAIKHGFHGTRTYIAWRNMHARCRRHNTNPRLARYGPRGIKVHPQFATFVGFLNEVGECPAGYTLDRIDCDGDYAPGNVRWASREEQARNRSDNRVLTFDGRTQVLADWAREFGISTGTLWFRLKSGWRLEQALTEPLMDHASAGRLGASGRWGER